ncbi:RAMP superfamily CRISPR-associated protein [Baaleninema sp.]|uniref:RAMP superfamily CRISPR-associated protein n=1 Tax=Baaleninema sp. TaxID=3101197 RepID=UPI003CFDC766
MDADRVPLAFRAQIEGRCQVQRINPDLKCKDGTAADNEAYIWTREWLRGASQEAPEFPEDAKTKEYEITWRFVTNSGQDDSIIRPVISGTGCPFYPGSSMKGAFRRACKQVFRDRVLKYCGGEVVVDGMRQTQPGILRFHGAYPVNDWKDESDLVDLVHPQQEWQVEEQASHSAFFMMSLFQPRLRFGISSSKTLSEEEWTEIWQVWETALGYGIGSRVSAGYGHVTDSKAPKLLEIQLKGEGLTSQRVNCDWEFRPNMFKGALRGHTLRLLGGVTTAEIARDITKRIWGGFAGRDGSVVGELGIAFRYDRNQLDDQTQGFELKQGQLDILLLNVRDEERRQRLRKFVIRLMKFSMMLGGFGKSWRRASHRQFFSNENYDRDIGCHWEFLGKDQGLYQPFHRLEDIRKYFQFLYSLMQDWVTQDEGQRLDAVGANWREAWHLDRVQVWARFDEDMEPISTALDWFHQDLDTLSHRSIKNSHLTGRLNQIGRIWHRMYPRYVKQDGKLRQRGFIEFLTIFPDGYATGDDKKIQQEFLRFLEEVSEFDRVW